MKIALIAWILCVAGLIFACGGDVPKPNLPAPEYERPDTTSWTLPDAAIQSPTENATDAGPRSATEVENE